MSVWYNSGMTEETRNTGTVVVSEADVADPANGIAIARPAGFTNIHISDVLAFKRCRRAWKWSSRLQRNLEPDRPYLPFYVGSALHYCMEHLYRYGTDYDQALTDFIKTHSAFVDKLSEADYDKVVEGLDLVRSMMQHYEVWRKYYKGPFNDADLEFIALEQTFNVPFRANGLTSLRLRLEGRFDGIVRRKSNGRLYVLEFKTTRSIQERIKVLPFEEQATVYSIAAQEMYGEPIAGVIYTLLRKKAPSTPAVLQNGTISLAKRIDTSFEWFLDTIRNHYGIENNSDIDKRYVPFLKELATKDNPFIQRFAIARNTKELARGAIDLWNAAQEMTRRSTPIYPHGGQHCAFCLFRNPCMALNTGMNYEMLLRNEYRERILDAADEAGVED